ALDGCGFIHGGTGADNPFTVPCQEHLDVELPASIPAAQPDVVVLMSTLGDFGPRTWDDGGIDLQPTDPEYLVRLQAGYTAISELIESTTNA
ncbi:MAG TPA: hypothetical protein PLV68_01425, partial [Ilumatobacteraceae bacterium]|nr:hypothetical protein [Ilumatobacteraceae bacterium]